jgi:hypothetical protein
MPFRCAWHVAMLASLCGCSAIWPMRPEDATAPGDYYHSVRPEKSTCSRAIQLWPTQPPSDRRYRQIAEISVTCYPGAITVCERGLRERACQMGADAVIALPAEGGGTPPGASAQSLVSRSGRAIRYEAERRDGK